MVYPLTASSQVIFCGQKDIGQKSKAIPRFLLKHFSVLYFSASPPGTPQFWADYAVQRFAKQRLY